MSVSDLPATEGDPQEGDHQDDPLLEDPHHRDLRQDATDALGPPPASRTPGMSGMIVMRTTHSHGAYETLIFPTGWRSLPKWTRTTGQPRRAHREH